MTALRTAAQQAPEALDEADTFHRNLPDQRARRLAAMAALRAALAESGRDWSLLEATQESLREHMAEIHRLRAALAQQAEPVEPVATLTAQRDALLEALKAAEPYLRHADVDYNVYVQCRAAIKAVEEGK